MSNPFWANVVLQLACDGADNSTTITDSGPSPKTVTAFGNARIRTAQSKFGGAALFLDGSGDYVRADAASDFNFGTGDFTVETWLRMDAAGTSKSLFDFRAFSDSALILYIGEDNKVVYNSGEVDRITSTTALSATTWHHIAVSRASGTARLFINGVQEGGNVTDSSTHAGTRVYIGMVLDGESLPFAGYFDDIRLHEAHAFYTANFTPPTSANPVGASSSVEARVSAEGPLSGSLLLARHFTDPGDYSGPLRPALVLGHSLFASIAVQGPLSAALVRTVHDFTDFVVGLTTLYVMDLVTPSGVVRAPISNWQATLRRGASNFVQCNIPACEPFVEDIATATGFVVYRRVQLDDGTAIESEMASADLSSASLAQGPRNYTATLTGFSAGFAEDEPPPEGLDRDLEDVRSVTSASSGLRVRCGVDWLLRPGMRARLNDVPFVVDRISYFVSTGDAYMDVSEVG